MFAAINYQLDFSLAQVWAAMGVQLLVHLVLICSPGLLLMTENSTVA